VQRASMAVLYGVSFALHASLGVGMAEIEPAREPERIAISMVDVPKPRPKVKEEPPPPPPPPPIEAPKPKAQPVAAAKSAEPPPETAPSAAADAPTFGLAMTGGVGLGGVAVPVGDTMRASAEPTKRVAQAKTLTESKVKQPLAEACAEPATKPRPLQMARPEYTEDARSAGIEGKVRVELTVDETGAVSNVKVLESLGHGLDEAAVLAVQGASFEPAMSCGKAISATFVVSIRFSL